MKYRKLGQYGLKVSELSLGGWITFGNQVKDQHLAKEMIHYAYDRGVNFFDIADIYARGESEKMMGSVLKDFSRQTLVISSKVFWPMSDNINDRGLSRKHIFESIHNSLKRIGTDYLDIYFCHRYDADTPVEETVRIMDDLIHQGKVLYWGTSEWSADQIHEAHQIAHKNNLYPPMVEQPQYHLLARKRMETEIMPVAKELGMGLTTFSPLAMGMLTGKYDLGIPDDSRLAREEWLRGRLLEEEVRHKVIQFKTLADEAGISRGELAIAWLRHQEGLSSIITGASRMEQLRSNLNATDIDLAPEMLEKISTLFAY